MSATDSSDEPAPKPKKAATEAHTGSLPPTNPVQRATGASEPQRHTAPVDRLDLIERLHQRMTSDWGAVGRNLTLLGGIALVAVLAVVVVVAAVPALISISSAHGAPAWLVRTLLGALGTTAVAAPVARHVLRRRRRKDQGQ